MLLFQHYFGLSPSEWNEETLTSLLSLIKGDPNLSTMRVILTFVAYLEKKATYFYHSSMRHSYTQ